MKKGFSFNHLMPGVYTPGDSVLHRTSVSRKIFLGLAILCLTAWGKWTGIAFVVLVCLSGIILAKTGFKMVLRKLRTFVWFVLFLGIFPVFFIPGTSVETLSVLGVTWEGLEAGALTSCRLMLMFLVSMLFMHTTAPQDLFALNNSGDRGGHSLWVSIREAGTVGLMAFQLLPILCIEVEKWLAVELNSGKDVVRGNLFQKARQVAGLLVPLTVSIFENTEQFSKRLHDEADRKQ
jgi:energy-coupling factor transporter transmembrane protein EcfT